MVSIRRRVWRGTCLRCKREVYGYVLSRESVGDLVVRSLVGTRASVHWVSVVIPTPLKTDMIEPKLECQER